MKIKYKIIQIIHIWSNYTSNRLNHSLNLMAGGVMSFSHGGGGGTPSSPSWGVPHLVMVRGTLSSHDGGGTNPVMVGVPIHT